MERMMLRRLIKGTMVLLLNFLPVGPILAGIGPERAIPPDDLASRVIYLMGVGEMEELDAQVLERFDAYQAHPIPINLMSRGRLLSTGLFSAYQLAVLEDYRERNGDILSIMELAYLDGFGEKFAWAVAPFISFASPGLDLDGSGRFSKGEVQVRTGRNQKGWAESMKVHYNHREKWEGNLALSNTTGHAFWPIERAGFHLTRYGRYHLNQLIVGDFNARFGQGLGIWSGFSIRGLSTSKSFYRRPTGLSPSNSGSDANFRGLASDFSWGRFYLSTALAFPGLRPWMEGRKPWVAKVMPLMNLAYYGQDGQASITAFTEIGASAPGRVSADFRYVWGNLSCWGETAFDWTHLSVGAVGGVSFQLGYQAAISLTGRYLPTLFYPDYSAPITSASKPHDEMGVGMGIDMKGYVCTLDWAWHPGTQIQDIRFRFAKEWALGSGFSIGSRCSERLKWIPDEGWMQKATLRLDWKWETVTWWTMMRTEAAYAENLGLLGYLEGGYRRDDFSVYLRGGAFRVDHWEDRIYAYERDAPGSFNVPAYYGRGFSASLFLTYKWQWGFDRLRTYLRAGLVRYPWEQEEKKPGKAELKLQITYDF